MPNSTLRPRNGEPTGLMPLPPVAIIDAGNTLRDEQQTMSATEVMEASVFDADPVRRLGRDSTGSLMTVDEFHEIDDVEDGLRYELLQGVVIVSPAPSESERDLNEELGYLLRVYRDSHPLGWNLDATMSEQELDTFAGVRRADRAIWTGLGRLPTPREDFPSIVVECVSRLSRDRRRDYEQKLQEYATAGVREYWIIDRFRRTLTVCAGGQIARVVREAETYTSPLLPDFELPLAKLLTLADRWPQ